MAEQYEGIYVIWGGPGTGKTRTLARQIQAIVDKVEPRNPDSSPVAVCSLTRAAAAEIAGRDLPIPDFQVGTLHSFAYRQIGSPDVAEAEVKDFNDAYPMFALAGGEIDIDDVTGEQLSENTASPGNEAYQKYSKYRAELRPEAQWEPHVQYFGRCWGEWKRKNSLVDFSDMIDLATADEHACAPGNPSVVIIDEGQDVSRQEWQLLARYYEAAGALMVAGDSYQSLYKWRGSDDSIFYDPAIPEGHRKVLKQSYRVPETVRNMAVNWIRHRLSHYVELGYLPRPERGVVEPLSATSACPDSAIALAESKIAQGETVMFATTCSYMLKTIVGQLRERGIPFANPWRTKNSRWNPLRPPARGQASHHLLMMMYDALIGRRNITFKELDGILSLFRVDGVLKRGAKAFFKQMGGEYGQHPASEIDFKNAFDVDAWKALKYCVASDDPEKRFAYFVSVNCAAQRAGAAKYAAGIISNYGMKALVKPPACYTGTIHSFKGSQVDNVFLFPDLSWAGDLSFSGNHGHEERDNVIRTFYVGMTRAKKSLYMCQPNGMHAVEIPLDFS